MRMIEGLQCMSTADILTRSSVVRRDSLSMASRGLSGPAVVMESCLRRSVGLSFSTERILLSAFLIILESPLIVGENLKAVFRAFLMLSRGFSCELATTFMSFTVASLPSRQGKTSPTLSLRWIIKAVSITACSVDSES